MASIAETSKKVDLDKFFNSMLPVAHNEQYYVCNVVNKPAYCQDNKARLRWRITPNNFGPNLITDKVRGLGAYVLRPKDLHVTAFGLVYRLPEYCQ